MSKAAFIPSADPLAGTDLATLTPPIGSNQPKVAYVDPSLEGPDRQFEYLAALLESNDAANPAPFTGTPPWGESIDPADTMPASVEAAAYMVPADLDAPAMIDVLALTRDPYPMDFPGTDWFNDQQYHGLGVPPGVENLDQPIESGHTQIIRQNPAAEQGWDAWSGRPQLARVARHENDFPGYSADVNRRHGVIPEKFEQPYALLTQQHRDLLLAELKRRGVHEVVVADVASVPFTEQVIVTDPLDMYDIPIGPEGVIPSFHGDHLAAGGGQ